MIRLTCLHCGRRLKVPDEFVRQQRRLKCPRCGERVQLSELAAAEATADASPEANRDTPDRSNRQRPIDIEPALEQRPPWLWPSLAAAGATLCAIVVLALI